MKHRLVIYSWGIFMCAHKGFLLQSADAVFLSHVKWFKICAYVYLRLCACMCLRLKGGVVTLWQLSLTFSFWFSRVALITWPLHRLPQTCCVVRRACIFFITLFSPFINSTAVSSFFFPNRKLQLTRFLVLLNRRQWCDMTHSRITWLFTPSSLHSDFIQCY